MDTKAFGMEKSSKRGKIPPEDWPSIIARYEAGETLTSIARSYDCSPPAISYIVSRTRARNAAADPLGGAAQAEPQLVKKEPPATLPATASPDGTTAGASPPGGTVATPVPAAVENGGERADRQPRQEAMRLFPDDEPSLPVVSHDAAGHDGEARAERESPPPRDSRPSGGGNGPRPDASGGTLPASDEPRRTLHLSLSGGDAGQHRHDRDVHPMQSAAGRGVGERAAPSHPVAAEPTAGFAARPHSPGNGAPVRVPEEPSATREAAGAFIDRALRERVGDDVAAFLAAFDAALDHDNAQSRTGLREATDRLLRAGARTRIELERLEARMPLMPRERSGQEGRSFRPR